MLDCIMMEGTVQLRDDCIISLSMLKGMYAEASGTTWAYVGITGNIQEVAKKYVERITAILKSRLVQYIRD